ncbi:hypothetical protein [Sulfuracidifex metallicus]|uniref:hypothetical protein n=1 Tax=Sulfuracidifex metallicus TaxID=47303 RepID=UPI000AD13B57|nr:hypothetical protein [Sulfuracidifex metallicus]
MVKKFLGIIVIVDTTTPEKLQEVIKSIDYVKVSEMRKRGEDYRFCYHLRKIEGKSCLKS